MEMYIICGLTFMEEYEMSCSIHISPIVMWDCVGDFRGCFHWCMQLSGGNYKQTPYSQCQRPQLLAWVNRCSLNIPCLEMIFAAHRLMPFCNVSECCVLIKRHFVCKAIPTVSDRPWNNTWWWQGACCCIYVLCCCFLGLYMWTPLTDVVAQLSYESLAKMYNGEEV